MSGFHPVRLPLRLGRGATLSLFGQTQILGLANGAEVRRADRGGLRIKWSLPLPNGQADDMAQLARFFAARLGRLYSFLFFDSGFCHTGRLAQHGPTYQDLTVGVGDDHTTSFDLAALCPLRSQRSDHGDGDDGDIIGEYSSPISARLPRLVGLSVAINGDILPPNAYQLAGRFLRFASAPTNGAIITAGYYFDHVVRFDEDQIDLSRDFTPFGRAGPISLIETGLAEDWAINVPLALEVSP